jgi:hypothetical protein
MPSSWQTVLRGSLVFVFYAFSFWRIAKTNRGNKVIECGSIALMTFLLLIFLMRLPTTPGWVLGSLGLLLFLLCLLTTAYLFQQGYRAIRNKMAKRND